MEFLIGQKVTVKPGAFFIHMHRDSSTSKEFVPNLDGKQVTIHGVWHSLSNSCISTYEVRGLSFGGSLLVDSSCLVAMPSTIANKQAWMDRAANRKFEAGDVVLKLETQKDCQYLPCACKGQTFIVHRVSTTGTGEYTCSPRGRIAIVFHAPHTLALLRPHDWMPTPGDLVVDIRDWVSRGVHIIWLGQYRYPNRVAPDTLADKHIHLLRKSPKRTELAAAGTQELRQKAQEESEYIHSSKPAQACKSCGNYGCMCPRPKR